MAESTLSILWQEIQAEVGLFLGWGRGANYSGPAWTANQQAVIDSCVKSGLRQFYFPPPAEGERSSYNWSFLTPTFTLDLPLGAKTIPLPDDFGGMEGRLSVLTTVQASQPWRIDWRNEGQIREMYSVTPLMEGPPMFAAQMPLKGTTATAGQRFQLFFFPAADQDYMIQGLYWINPDYLSGAFPYAYGGAPHAETILESCLAIAEQRLDDATSVHTQKFAERLLASINLDRRSKPQSLGPNRDRSDESYGDTLNIHYAAPPATYNGGSFN